MPVALELKLCEEIISLQSDNAATRTFFYEKFLLDELNSYWDGLDARLTVSRKASDAFMKGMANVVTEEAAVPNAQFHPLANERSLRIPVGSNHLSLPSCSEIDCSRHISKLKTVVEVHLEDLLKNVRSKEVLSGRAEEESLMIDKSANALSKSLGDVFGKIDDMFSSLKTAFSDCQWEKKFQEEIDCICIANSIRGICDGFETELYVQKKCWNSLSEKWRKNLDELSIIREELDAMLRTVSLSEPGLVSSHNSHDGLEEWNAAIFEEECNDSDKTFQDVADCTELNSMTKEEACAYYRNRMIEMRRQHDSALQEKTEELFKLKREFLKEKGTFHLRREREFESLRRKIPHVIKKLEGVLNKKDVPPVVHDDHLKTLKDRADAFYIYNQHLRSLLACKSEEILCLSAQVTDAAAQFELHSSIEANLLKQINALKCDINDLQIEDAIKDDLYKCLFRESFGSLVMEIEILRLVYSVIFRGIRKKEKSEFISESMYNEQHDRHELVCQELNDLRGQLNRQDVLFSETKMELDLEKSGLNDASQERAWYEEERRNSDLQKEQFDLVCQELIVLKDQLSRKDNLISVIEFELDSARSRLCQVLEQNAQYEVEISKLNREVKMSLNTLAEAEKQNDILRQTIEEKQSALTEKEEQVKWMDHITIFMMEFSKAIANLDYKLAQSIERADARLSALSHECTPLVQQVTSSRRKELWHKKILEIRWSNLQKAEAEVDLLGDEVDALLGLLGKIYLALNHYSPVLQHYPGIMEILKLVQRELGRENNKPEII